MVIQLTPSLQSKVDHLVESGRFDDPESVLEASLSLLQEREERLEWLRHELALAEEQVRRGEVIEYTPELVPRLLTEAIECNRKSLQIGEAVQPPD